MKHYSTSPGGRQHTVKNSLKDVQIVNPERAAEIRAERRALRAWEYREKTGFDLPDEYISAGCPTTNPETGLPLGYSHISDRMGKKPDCYPEIGTGVVTIFENDIQIARPGAPLRGGGLRGVIRTFSDGSRGRMQKYLNRLHWPKSQCYFVTFTYPDDFPDFETATRQFEIFLKRLARAFPEVAGVWRKELKRRKSGKNEGKIAPHYHTFLWGLGDDIDNIRSWCAENWTEIAGQADPVNHLEHGCEVLPVVNRKQAIYYITKYMTKSENDAALPAGRMWGHFGSLDTSPLQVLRMGQMQLAVLRALVLEWLLRAFMPFWGRLRNYPEHAGFHVYGIPVTEVERMIQQVVRFTVGEPPPQAFQAG